MARLFIFPIGYHEDFILRRLAKCGASGDDRVFVITCKPYSLGTRSAFENLKARMLDLGYGTPLLIGLECSSPWDSILELENILSDRDGVEEVIVDLSGGMRILSIYILFTLYLLRINFNLYVQPESGLFEEVLIPNRIINLLFNPLTDVEKKVLEIITNNPGITIKELSITLGKKEKTIANIVSRLRNRGLVMKKTKAQHIHPTPWAKIIVSSRQIQG